MIIEEAMCTLRERGILSLSVETISDNVVFCCRTIVYVWASSRRKV